MFLRGLAGAVGSAVLGIIGTLLLAAPRGDRTFGMREVLIGMPLMALICLVAGVALARTL